MDWLLSAEERTAVVNAVQPDAPYGAVLERIAQAQLRKVVEKLLSKYHSDRDIFLSNEDWADLLQEAGL
jgi:hypothetical protein